MENEMHITEGGAVVLVLASLVLLVMASACSGRRVVTVNDPWK